MVFNLTWPQIDTNTAVFKKENRSDRDVYMRWWCSYCFCPQEPPKPTQSNSKYSFRSNFKRWPDETLPFKAHSCILLINAMSREINQLKERRENSCESCLKVSWPAGSTEAIHFPQPFRAAAQCSLSGPREQRPIRLFESVLEEVSAASATQHAPA